MHYILAMIDGLAWLRYVVGAVMVGVPALVGSVLIVVAVRRWGRLRALAAEGQRATGRVVDNQLESWSDGRTRFRPVVTFRTSSGQEVTTVLEDLAGNRSHLVGGNRSHLVGTEVELFYDPEKPADAAPARSDRAGFVVALVFGVIFLVFAVCAFRVTGLVFSQFEEFGGFGDAVEVGDPDPFGG
jgi:hypothetical protein